MTVADLWEEVNISDTYIRRLRDELAALEVELGVAIMERTMLIEQIQNIQGEIDWG